MALIHLHNIKHEFGTKQLLKSVSLAIEPGEKTGFIGANGSGKSTLLRIIAGSLDAQEGTIVRAPSSRVAYVPQDFDPPQGLSCLDILCEPFYTLRAELADLETAMGTSDAEALDKVLRRYGELRETYDSRKGDEAESKAERLLESAGLEGSLDREAASLSGGERHVLGLARALMSDPDLLLLDEPGNHLDAWGLAWLEEFIRSLPMAVFMVSHDRALLDRCVGRIVELDKGELRSFTGNYSQYKLERLRSTATQGAAHQADKKKLERLEALVRRLADIARVRADKSNGKRLRARRHQLELARESAAEAPDLGPAAPRIAFGTDASASRIAVDLRAYAKRFGDRVLVEASDALIEAGQRVALVGQNGSGKSTLLRDIVAASKPSAKSDGISDSTVPGSAEAAPFEGEIRVGPSQRIGYCSQRHEGLHAGRTVFEEVEERGLKRNQAIPFLGAYRFAAIELDKPVSQLSGGERAMLQFACVLLEKPNLLILDEPSNHLDIPAREALEDALDEFQGTVVIVSHDRYLLERVAGRVLWFDAGKLRDFEGAYDDFWDEFMQDQPLRLSAAANLKHASSADTPLAVFEKRGQHKASHAPSTANPGKTPGSGAKNANRPGGNRNGATQANDIEKRILALEAEQKQLEKTIAQANKDRDYALARRLSGDLAKLLQRIEELYAKWQ